MRHLSLHQLARQRILVTGASGFLGRHLTKRLAALGAEVHGVSRSDREGTPGPTRWWRAQLEDFTELERVWDFVQPDIVYHLSGRVIGHPALDHLLPTYHSLLTTTVNLLSLATRRKPRRLILIGSLEEEDPGDAGAPPASPYAAAKTAARAYARMCHEVFGTPAVILRTFMAYGPGQPEWKVIPSTVRALIEGVSPTLSSGRRKLDWVFVDDVIEGFLSAAVAPEIEGKTIDIGSGRLVSIREVVEHLVQLINPSIKPRFGANPDHPERPARAADVAHAQECLHWKAQTPLEVGLKLTVEAFRSSRIPGTGPPDASS